MSVNEKTILYQLTETSEFMMSFVIITKENNAIVIDGGRPLDMPLLKEYIGGRHISAWILTHPHLDHISGFVDEFSKNGGADFDIEKVYYNFPPLDHTESPDAPWYDGFMADMQYEELSGFYKVLPILGDKAHIAQKGETAQIDECKIEFIYTWHKELKSNLFNDSSLVFKVITPNKTVLFLGDLGPDGGDVLFYESHKNLKADIVQMAHHGHGCVSMEVYAEIMPEACMWCCADWLYNEDEDLGCFDGMDAEEVYRIRQIRMRGTKLTRKWMDILGVKTHYVTKDGTNRIEI